MQITEAEEKLRNPRHDEILTGLRWLMDAGMAYPVTIPEGNRSEAYIAVLANVPICGLRKALKKLKTGEYENINLAFIPLPAELAAMSRAEAKTERDDLLRLRDTQRTIEETKRAPGPASEESKARVRKLLEAFRAENRARKEAEQGPRVEEEPTAEQIERWKKIMAMPDAPRELTAEQHEHRRKIAAKIEKAEKAEANDRGQAA